MSPLTFQNIVDDGALLFVETHHFQDDRFEEWGYQRWNTTGDERGSYRARLHATGRDTAFDLVVESPVERHLVQFWKEPPSPVSVLSSESEDGKSLPSFIKMWQGPPAATAHAGPRLITQDSPPAADIISGEADERAP
jgi:hypothetical protein